MFAFSCMIFFFVSVIFKKKNTKNLINFFARNFSWVFYLIRLFFSFLCALCFLLFLFHLSFVDLFFSCFRLWFISMVFGHMEFIIFGISVYDFDIFIMVFVIHKKICRNVFQFWVRNSQNFGWENDNRQNFVKISYVSFHSVSFYLVYTFVFPFISLFFF